MLSNAASPRWDTGAGVGAAERGRKSLESLKLLEAKVQAKREEEARAKAKQIPEPEVVEVDYEIVEEDK